MYSAITPRQLYDLAVELRGRGARGILISGGSDLRGRTPFIPFLRAIKRIKDELELVISIHPGLVSENDAELLRINGVDIVDYELILDPTVIKEIKGLKQIEPSDYINSLINLLEKGPTHVATHIPIGFRYGKIKYEYEAVDAAIEYNVEMIVFLVFTPTPGTPMYSFTPPQLNEVVSIMKYSRRRFGGIIALGCMRPPIYRRKLDTILISSGLIDRVVNPLPHIAREKKLEIYGACCSVPEYMLEIFPKMALLPGLTARI